VVVLRWGARCFSKGWLALFQQRSCTHFARGQPTGNQGNQGKVRELNFEQKSQGIVRELGDFA